MKKEKPVVQPVVQPAMQPIEQPIEQTIEKAPEESVAEIASEVTEVSNEPVESLVVMEQPGSPNQEVTEKRTKLRKKSPVEGQESGEGAP